MFNKNLDHHHEDRLPLYTKDGLRHYLQSNHKAPAKLTGAQYLALSEFDCRRYDADRRRHLAGDIIIGTPTVMEARQKIATMIQNNDRIVGDIRPGCIISGDGTTGKTTITKTVMQSVYDDYVDEFPDFEEAGRLPVVFTEVPTSSTGRVLAAALINSLGGTVHIRETQPELMTRVFAMLRAFRTELIVVDELHNLNGNNQGIVDSISTLRQLHNNFPGILVFAGVKLIESKLFTGSSGSQLGGRMSLIEVNKFTLGSKPEAELWKALVRAFENEMPLFAHTPGTLAKHSVRLHEHTGGSISTLGKIFASAAKGLIREHNPETETISLELLLAQTRDMNSEYRTEIDSAKTARAKKAATR